MVRWFSVTLNVTLKTSVNVNDLYPTYNSPVNVILKAERLIVVNKLIIG